MALQQRANTLQQQQLALLSKIQPAQTDLKLASEFLQVSTDLEATRKQLAAERLHQTAIIQQAQQSSLDASVLNTLQNTQAKINSVSSLPNTQAQSQIIANQLQRPSPDAATLQAAVIHLQQATRVPMWDLPATFEMDVDELGLCAFHLQGLLFEQMEVPKNVLLSGAPVSVFMDAIQRNNGDLPSLSLQAQADIQTAISAMETYIVHFNLTDVRLPMDQPLGNAWYDVLLSLLWVECAASLTRMLQEQIYVRTSILNLLTLQLAITYPQIQTTTDALQVAIQQHTIVIENLHSIIPSTMNRKERFELWWTMLLTMIQTTQQQSDSETSSKMTKALGLAERVLGSLQDLTSRQCYQDASNMLQTFRQCVSQGGNTCTLGNLPVIGDCTFRNPNIMQINSKLDQLEQQIQYACTDENSVSCQTKKSQYEQHLLEIAFLRMGLQYLDEKVVDQTIARNSATTLTSADWSQPAIKKPNIPHADYGATAQTKLSQLEHVVGMLYHLVVQHAPKQELEVEYTEIEHLYGEVKTQYDVVHEELKHNADDVDLQQQANVAEAAMQHADIARNRTYTLLHRYDEEEQKIVERKAQEAVKHTLLPQTEVRCVRNLNVEDTDLDFTHYLAKLEECKQTCDANADDDTFDACLEEAKKAEAGFFSQFQESKEMREAVDGWDAVVTARRRLFNEQAGLQKIMDTTEQELQNLTDATQRPNLEQRKANAETELININQNIAANDIAWKQLLADYAQIAFAKGSINSDVFAPLPDLFTSKSECANIQRETNLMTHTIQDWQQNVKRCETEVKIMCNSILDPGDRIACVWTESEKAQSRNKIKPFGDLDDLQDAVELVKTAEQEDVEAQQRYHEAYEVFTEKASAVKARLDAEPDAALKQGIQDQEALSLFVTKSKLMEMSKIAAEARIGVVTAQSALDGLVLFQEALRRTTFPEEEVLGDDEGANCDKPEILFFTTLGKGWTSAARLELRKQPDCATPAFDAEKTSRAVVISLPEVQTKYDELGNIASRRRTSIKDFQAKVDALRQVASDIHNNPIDLNTVLLWQQRVEQLRDELQQFVFGLPDIRKLSNEIDVLLTPS